MKGFLMYHVLGGRRSFVDELYVSPTARRQNVARSLLAHIARGPIELIVDKTNVRAIALYVSSGFCSTNRPTYEPHDHEIAMRTTSFRRTRAALEPFSSSHTTRTYVWSELPREVQENMIEGMRTEWKLNVREAKKKLRTFDRDIRYILIH